MRIGLGLGGGWRAWLLAVSLAAATVPWVDVAQAEPTKQELARAREAFRKGLELEAANDWAGALASFEAVAQVTVTPQVRFHIARCQHRLGKLLEALGGYKYAAHEAANDPKVRTDPKLAELVREAEAGIAELEARIPKLTIRRGKGAEAASVTLDGVALGETSVGKEVLVNPGGHTIDYSLSDGRTDQKVVTLQEGDTQTIELSFDVATRPVKPPPTEPPPPVEPATEQKSNVVPWVLVGVGGASVVTSGVFYLMRSSAISDHDSQCVNNVCPTSLKDKGDSGKTYTTLGNITLGLGLVGIGVGTVMLLTGGDDAPPASKPGADSAALKPRMNVVVGGSHHGAEASLVGTF